MENEVVDRLNKAIKDRNLSYVELEKLTKISKSALQRYASGQTKKIPLDVITSIAPILGVTPQYLMGQNTKSERRVNDSEKILTKAIGKYGSSLQLDVAIEEMAELTKELVKNKRGDENRENIMEEVADVFIMLMQIRLIFGIGDKELDDVIDKKINRLERNLQDD